MKYHYIYFIAIPVLLLIAMTLPLQINELQDGTRDIRNTLEEKPAIILFITPTILGTILLLIRNHITAVIGTCLYILALVFAGIMNYIIFVVIQPDNAGISPSAIFIVLLFAVIISLNHTIKLVKSRKKKDKDQGELLDTF